MFCHDVHCNFGKVKVCADTGGGCDAGLAQDFLYNLDGQLMSRHLVVVEVVGDINEDFVNGVGVYVLVREIAQVYFVDTCAVVDIECHSRRCGDVVDCQFGMSLKLYVVDRLACEFVFRGVKLTVFVDFTHTLHHLKKACAPSYTVCFHRRRHGETDGLVGSRCIGNHKIGRQWIKSSFDTLDRGVERFKVDGDIGALCRQ